MAVLDFLRPAPYKSEMEDPAAIKAKYKYWRIRVFYGMYIGYIFYYFTRKSLGYALPFLMVDLGFDKAQLSILTSVLAISYAVSKFLSGYLSDSCNPRYFMAIGLIVTGIFNICFGFSSSILLFAVFWGLNGWFQGWGWPPCARLLTHWYSQKERGRWWGFWNTSTGLGSLAVYFIIAYFIVGKMGLGWRYAMFIPGWMCIGAGLFVINRLRDTPQSLGLPSVEKFKNDAPELVKEEKSLSSKEILFKYVLKNKFIWLLGASYFFIYVIRTAVSEWGLLLFLMESKEYSYKAAGLTVVLFEIGGILGSLAAGWASDKIFQGRRGPVNVLFSLGIIFGITAVWFVPPGFFVLDCVLLFSTGFLVFGPQMLIGMAAAELSHKRAAGTASGFVGLIAYLGAATAGYPLGKLTQEYGWHVFFTALALCACFAFLLLIPLWNAKSSKQAIEPVISAPEILEGREPGVQA